MDQQVSILTLFVAVATSFIGSLFFFWYSRGREKRIKAKIAELQFEDEFLDKLKKGNVHLIRSGFKVISFSLFLIFSSGAALFAAKIIPVSDVLFKNILIVVIGMWALAAAICFSLFRSLVRLHDVQGFKEKNAAKLQKLESKL